MLFLWDCIVDCTVLYCWLVIVRVWGFMGNDCEWVYCHARKISIHPSIFALSIVCSFCGTDWSWLGCKWGLKHWIWPPQPQQGHLASSARWEGDLHPEMVLGLPLHRRESGTHIPRLEMGCMSRSQSNRNSFSLSVMLLEPWVKRLVVEHMHARFVLWTWKKRKEKNRNEKKRRLCVLPCH